MADASVTGFTKEKIEALIGATIVSVRVVNGRDLIFATESGVEIDAGDIAGIKMTNATATNLPSTATGTVTSTNVQAALAELDADFSSLNTSKLRSNQVKKILSGRVNHVCDFAQAGGVQRTDCRYTNIFPSGYFLTAPEVLITPVKSNYPNEIAAGWSARSVTTRSFTINAYSAGTEVDQNGEYTVPIPLPFYWVASANEFFA